MIITDSKLNKFEFNIKITLYNIYANLTFNLPFNVSLLNLHSFKTKYTPAYRTILFSWSGFQRVVRNWLIHDANANRKQCFQDKTNTKFRLVTSHLSTDGVAYALVRVMSFRIHRSFTSRALAIVSTTGLRPVTCNVGESWAITATLHETFFPLLWLVPCPRKNRE